MQLFYLGLLTFAAFYKFFAIPLGVLLAFFLTWHLLKHHAALAATGMTLGWTVGMFTPLVTPAHTFFGEMYSPWYVALTMTPPSPEWHIGGLLITVVLSLMSSGLAIFIARR